MICIYINERPLYLASELNSFLEALKRNGDVMLCDETTPSKIKEIYTALLDGQYIAGICLAPDLTGLLQIFKTTFPPIIAAGGFIYTPAGDVLLIFRRGKWDLPKGKLDKGETLERCALREVAEETGLSEVVIKSPLHITYHIYTERGAPVLKESHWYLMETPLATPLKPQIEEDIESCTWVNVSEMASYQTNMYNSIKEVLKKGLMALRPEGMIK